MGSSSSREEIENKMSLIKLKRMEIQVQKEKELKKLADIDGNAVKGTQVPDYIDPEFAKQKNLFTENGNTAKNKDEKNAEKNSTSDAPPPKSKKGAKESNSNSSKNASSKSVKKVEKSKVKGLKSKFNKSENDKSEKREITEKKDKKGKKKKK